MGSCAGFHQLREQFTGEIAQGSTGIEELPGRMPLLRKEALEDLKDGVVTGVMARVR